MTYEYDAAHEADMVELRREQMRDDYDDGEYELVDLDDWDEQDFY